MLVGKHVYNSLSTRDLECGTIEISIARQSAEQSLMARKLYKQDRKNLEAA